MLPCPSTLRDTFELLGRLQDGRTLDQVIALVDWQDATPQQVCYAALGRLPQDLFYSGLSAVAFDAGGYFRSLLLGAEFQAEILRNLLGAYPDKPRRFFVHVPRSGGTSFGDTLAERTCVIQHNSLGPDWCSGTAFLQSVGALSRSIHQHGQIHVIGHYTLRMIMEDRLARFGDAIWTSVRPPQEIVLSFINYILTTIEGDPELSRPDARAWSHQLGLDRAPSLLGPDRLRALLPRMIRQDGLLPRDLLCHFLGDGTAASAADLLASSNAEVIDSRRLDVWREQRWANATQPWANVSYGFFKWRELGEQERRQVDGLVRQDLILHHAVASSLAGGVSTTGLQIAACARRLEIGGGSDKTTPRVRRAARPVLLDPVFRRKADAELAWSDPPLDYRTIETTLMFPTVETRVRVRYRRRPLRALGVHPTARSLRAVFASALGEVRALPTVAGLGRLVGLFRARLSRP